MPSPMLRQQPIWGGEQAHLFRAEGCSPRDVLQEKSKQALMEAGAKVGVCGLFRDERFLGLWLPQLSCKAVGAGSIQEVFLGTSSPISTGRLARDHPKWKNLGAGVTGCLNTAGPKATALEEATATSVIPAAGQEAWVEHLKEKLISQAQEVSRLRSELGGTDLEKHRDLLMVENERLRQEMRRCEAELQELRAKPPGPCLGCEHSQVSRMAEAPMLVLEGHPGSSPASQWLQESAQLRDKLSQLQLEMAESKGMLSELNLEVQQKTDRLAEVELRLKDCLAEKAQEEERLSRRLRDSHETIASLRAQSPPVKYVIKTVEVESPKTKQALSESQARNQHLQEQVAMQRQVLKEMEQQLQSSHQLTARLRAQIAMYESELERAHGQMLEEMQSLEEDKNRAIEEAFARAQVEMKAVHENLAGVRTNLLTLQPALRTLTNDYNGLKRQVRGFPLLLQEALRSVKAEIGQAIEEVNSNNQELLRKYRRELQLRKKCHNELVRLKGNIRVIARVRPVTKEDGEGPEATNAVTFDADDDSIIHLLHKGKPVSFELDKVFSPQASQQDLWLRLPCGPSYIHTPFSHMAPPTVPPTTMAVVPPIHMAPSTVWPCVLSRPLLPSQPIPPSRLWLLPSAWPLSPLLPCASPTLPPYDLTHLQAPPTISPSPSHACQPAMPVPSCAHVFQEVQALITSCIDGFNVCIFAYGQTGAGKTYTMEGTPENPGINQRALQLLFSEVQEKASDWEYTITVSAAEIYNEVLRDLLGKEPQEKLEIRLCPDGSGQLYVPGLTEFQVQSVDDINKVFEFGHTNRTTEFTNLNEHSSRSHALLIVTVRGVDCSTGLRTTGKLNLVDLAGSERVGKSGAEGSRLREAQHINKSLSALGDVIAALRSHQGHVPFRNSKLTYLLQDSLSGDSKTLMVVQQQDPDTPGCADGPLSQQLESATAPLPQTWPHTPGVTPSPSSPPLTTPPLPPCLPSYPIPRSSPGGLLTSPAVSSLVTLLPLQLAQVGSELLCPLGVPSGEEHQ
ncbi:Kinesin-like protein kifc3 [Saguinus oedipus]|uniref:Kinesin-like protein kifc3 n=1 Tax=Saguinus oedipus TaxID=9490 RepID=A0ABQ9TK44_SAGOE|nr:Kinesin-like protein kifc3 [Saguinus oedipus]